MPASCGKGPGTLPTEGQQAQRARAMSPPVHQFLTQLKLESRLGSTKLVHRGRHTEALGHKSYRSSELCSAYRWAVLGTPGAGVGAGPSTAHRPCGSCQSVLQDTVSLFSGRQ